MHLPNVGSMGKHEGLAQVESGYGFVFLYVPLHYGYAFPSLLHSFLTINTPFSERALFADFTERKPRTQQRSEVLLIRGATVLLLFSLHCDHLRMVIHLFNCLILFMFSLSSQSLT